MPTTLVPLLLAVAAPGAPAIVLTPASPAPPLATRCGPASRQGDGSEVECLVEQPRAGGQPTPTMRILIRTTPATPCRALEAQAVAVPAAAAPSAARLPVVVQPAREPACPR